MSDVDECLAFGRDALTAAGSIAAARFRTSLTIENKAAGGFDPVTTADRLVESALREAHRSPLPYARHPRRGTWHQAGHFRLAMDHRPHRRHAGVHDRPAHLGMPARPAAGRRAGAGLYAPARCRRDFLWRRRKRLGRARGRSREDRRQSDHGAARSGAVRHAPRHVQGSHTAALSAIGGSGPHDRYGGDCYHYCLLAHGLVDLVVEDSLKPYDILPLVPIVRGAGGRVTDLAGETPRSGVALAAATDALHAAALRTMRG